MSKFQYVLVDIEFVFTGRNSAKEWHLQNTTQAQ